MKRTLTLLTALLLASLPICVCAYDFEVDGIYYNITTAGEEVEVTYATGYYSGEVTIPSTVEYDSTYYSVTSIGENAFYWCRSLTSINIPSSVTTIGGWAFRYCKSLTSIDIPSSVTSIGNYAFYSCSSLTSIDIPSSVTSIGEAAFDWCTGLTSITVSDSNANYYSIDGVLYNKAVTQLICCPGAKTSIDIPSSVTSIGDYAFGGCESLTSVDIPSSVTTIGEWAFGNCTSLTSIDIPSRVTSIDYHAFYGCTGLTSVTSRAETPPSTRASDVLFSSTTFDEATLYVPASAVDDYATTSPWSSFTTIEGIDTEDSVLTVGDTLSVGGICFTVTNATTLEVEITRVSDYSGALVLPSSVTYEGCTYTITGISSRAFYNCTGLTSITILCNITVINAYTFYGCSSLTSVTLPEGLTEIGEYAFYGCTKLTDITLPKSLTRIGSYAFHGCTGLTSITILCNITIINAYTFYGCSSLTSVTLPEGLTEIGEYAFYGCTKLTDISLPKSLTRIGSYAFHGCTGLASLTLPESVTEIGEHAFHGCTGLTSITVLCNITVINAYTFYGCSSLTSVTLPESLTEIGEYAFYGCTKLTDISLPEGLTRIGSYAFHGCTGLASLTLPESVTEIGEHAFHGCTGLTSITVLCNITVINAYTFYGCSSLTSVTLPEGLTEIGECAFYGCSSLTSIDLPQSITSIGDKAFYGCTGLTSVISLAKTPPTATDNLFSSTTYATATLYVPASAVEDYAATSPWSLFSCLAVSDVEEDEDAADANAEAYERLMAQIAAAQEALDVAADSVNGSCADVADSFSAAISSIQASIDSLSAYVLSQYEAAALTEESAVDTLSIYVAIDALLADALAAEAAYVNGVVYAALTEQIDALQTMLDSATDSITRECPNVADDYTDDVADIQDAIDALHAEVDALYEAGLLTADSSIETDDIIEAINSLVAEAIADEGAFTGIGSVEAGNASGEGGVYYSLSGQRMRAPEPGTVSILRLSDGTTKKVMVK